MAAAVASSAGTQKDSSRFQLCVIEGDGIGHEVIPAAVEVLAATGFVFDVNPASAGWDTFTRHGTALPDQTLDMARDSDAVLFGAVSSPSHKVAGYTSPIVEMRRRLNLFANLRPTHSWPIQNSRPGIDLLIVRENSEGLYVRRESSDGKTAVAERIITQAASERIAHVAFRWAQQRQRHLTIVHKANVLPETCGLFRLTALGVAGSYPDVTVDEMLVDAMALRLVTNPERFDVIVTTNLFGDILSDEAAGLVGGLGLAPSANVGIGLSPALFEPVHGSAPDIAGKGLANPIAAFLAVAMLLDHNAEPERAGLVRDAVTKIMRNGPHSPDLGGTATTQQITIEIINMVKSANMVKL
ncbi:MAG: isocitrate/isopropylmalate dehydrogenase family protein [Anaerolineales bacterium]|nr:MAG: isocitrate/isopropylmalate dehydrogenase family protein [Anaerolineales bacterium]